MKRHDLKCWPGVFEAMRRGEKTAEYRRNDRDFAAADVLVLREWDPVAVVYTGRVLRVQVTHLVRGGQFGIPDGFCVMSTRLWVDLNEDSNCDINTVLGCRIETRVAEIMRICRVVARQPFERYFRVQACAEACVVLLDVVAERLRGVMPQGETPGT